MRDMLARKKVPKWRKDSKSIEKYQFIYHFLPHPEHKKRATLLSHKAILFYFLLLTTIFVGFRLVAEMYPGVLGYASNITISDLLEKTNEDRIKNGLSTLSVNERLSQAAYKKALDMFEEGYWAHISPTGTEPWDFILAQDYDYSYAGENLAKNFNTSDDVVAAWMESPSHRDNLLNKNYDEVGFAVVNGVLDGYETTLVVQMFGRTRESYLASLSPQQTPEVTGGKEAVSDQNLSAQEPELKPVVYEIKQVKVNEPAFGQQGAAEGLKAPALDVSTAAKVLGVTFVAYLLVLLSLDVWYSWKHSIHKISGHTLAHVSFLIFAVFGMLLTMIPGRIL